MIHIFRRIRKSLISNFKIGRRTLNGAERYFLYAIGEIVLVVIGILIALQINNWNEQRKADNSQKAIIEQFEEDLKLDLRGYEFNKKWITEITDFQKKIFEFGTSGQKEIELHEPQLVRAGVVINPVSKENDPNLAYKISNPELRNQILDYFKKIKHAHVLNDNLGHFMETEMRKYLRTKKIYNVESRFRNQIEHDATSFNLAQLHELAKDEIFHQLLFEANLKMNGIQLDLDELIQKNIALNQSIADSKLK